MEGGLKSPLFARSRRFKVAEDILRACFSSLGDDGFVEGSRSDDARLTLDVTLLLADDARA